MEFEETLGQALDRGWEKFQTQRDADRAFDGKWKEARRVVHQVFRAAESYLRQDGREITVVAGNHDGSELFRIGFSGMYVLVFEPDPENSSIVCRADAPSRDQLTAELQDCFPPDRFSPESITTELVQKKTADFVEALFSFLADRTRTLSRAKGLLGLQSTESNS